MKSRELHTIGIALVTLFIFFILATENFSSGEMKVATFPSRDTIRPVMELVGSANDTAYLNSVYHDPQVRLLDEVNGVLRCTNIKVDVTGYVDTRFPGIYVLKYNAKDNAGNSAAALTRTVHVVKGGMTEMYGTYAVVCTCTAIERGSSSPTITSGKYEATVIAGSQKQCFDLSALRIGPQFVKSVTCAIDNRIEVSFFSAEMHPRSSGTGTLSASKNSFTIETTAYQWNPAVNYFCKNVFTQMKLTEIKK